MCVASRQKWIVLLSCAPPAAHKNTHTNSARSDRCFVSRWSPVPIRNYSSPRIRWLSTIDGVAQRILAVLSFFAAASLYESAGRGAACELRCSAIHPEIPQFGIEELRPSLPRYQPCDPSQRSVSIRSGDSISEGGAPEGISAHPALRPLGPLR